MPKNVRSRSAPGRKARLTVRFPANRSRVGSRSASRVRSIKVVARPVSGRGGRVARSRANLSQMPISTRIRAPVAVGTRIQTSDRKQQAVNMKSNDLLSAIVGPASNNTATAVWRCMNLNPGLSFTDTPSPATGQPEMNQGWSVRLPQIANLYERYQLEDMVLEFTSMDPTTRPGVVGFTWIADPDEPLPAANLLEFFMDHAGTTTMPVWQSGKIRINHATMIKRMRESKKVRNGVPVAVTDGSSSYNAFDLNNYDVGRLFIWTTGLSTASENVGLVRVYSSLKFIDQRSVTAVQVAPPAVSSNYAQVLGVVQLAQLPNSHTNWESPGALVGTFVTAPSALPDLGTFQSDTFAGYSTPAVVGYSTANTFPILCTTSANGTLSFTGIPTGRYLVLARITTQNTAQLFAAANTSSPQLGWSQTSGSIGLLLPAIRFVTGATPIAHFYDVGTGVSSSLTSSASSTTASSGNAAAPVALGYQASANDSGTNRTGFASGGAYGQAFDIVAGNTVVFSFSAGQSATGKTVLSTILAATAGDSVPVTQPPMTNRWSFDFVQIPSAALGSAEFEGKESAVSQLDSLELRLRKFEEYMARAYPTPPQPDFKEPPRKRESSTESFIDVKVPRSQAEYFSAVGAVGKAKPPASFDAKEKR